MNHPVSRVAIAVLVLSLALIACAPPRPLPTPAAQVQPAPSPAPIRVTDALGREVVLPASPQRIVLSGRALFMVADAIYTFPQAGERIAGMGQTAQGSGNFIKMIDPAYTNKATLERDAGPEQVAALQPDLVILKSSVAESLGKPIEALNIPVVYVDFETPEQYARDIAILGQIFNDSARAQTVIDFYQSKTEAVKKAVAGAVKPRVLLLYYNDRDGAVAFNVPPLNWIQTQMVELAGGQPVWADANPSKGWTQVALEQIAAWDADHIFIVSYFKDPSQVTRELWNDPNWQALRAVQSGALHAFPVDAYSWDQPDTRWILGLTWMAGVLHPDRFPGLDIRAEMKTFYQTLYGLDAAFVEQNLFPMLKGDVD
ncbi:MAG: ABC transporter substrate-binding protein [Anaerolineae bacterium]|nr:ABC transporter substrate-binding protein [Thermoflexales bacterium]MDW8407332.1 ABC transporter substrate-binding protein [Anaerolineae bacterium]